jgi:hypothetical protein
LEIVGLHLGQPQANSTRPYLKIKLKQRKGWRPGSMPEHLSSKCWALSSNAALPKKKKEFDLLAIWPSVFKRTK